MYKFDVIDRIILNDKGEPTKDHRFSERFDFNTINAYRIYCKFMRTDQKFRNSQMYFTIYP